MVNKPTMMNNKGTNSPYRLQFQKFNFLKNIKIKSISEPLTKLKTFFNLLNSL